MAVLIYQIYHELSQKANLIFPGYYNPAPAEFDANYLFMEASVMRKLVENGHINKSNWLGVLSPNFLRKIEECKKWGKDIRGQTKNKFSLELLVQFILEQAETDIIAIVKHPPHNVFKVADRYHPGFKKLCEQIFHDAGIAYNFEAVNQNPIYFNYFIAAQPVYSHFVETMLAPVMDVILNDDTIKAKAMQDSRYPKPIPKYFPSWGLSHWPYHPFITERLISSYITKQKNQVKYF